MVVTTLIALTALVVNDLLGVGEVRIDRAHLALDRVKRHHLAVVDEIDVADFVVAVEAVDAVDDVFPLL